MADRLVARGTLIGKTRAEAVELLGEPPQTGYFTDRDLVYWLGYYASPILRLAASRSQRTAEGPA